MRILRSRRLTIGALLLLALAAAGCDDAQVQRARLTQTFDSEPVRVIASEHLRFLDVLVDDIRTRTGVSLDVDYRDEITINRAIQNADHRYTLAWPMSNHFLARLPEKAATESPPFFSSPVVLGLDTAAEKALRWCDSPVDWQTINAAVTDAKTRLAIPRPQPANTGYLALLAAAQATRATSGEPLLVAADTRYLGDNDLSVDTFMQLPPGKSLIAPEKVLQDAIERGAEICIAYPRDGVASATFPLMLIDPKYEPTLDALRRYFTADSFQERLSGFHLRKAKESLPDLETTQLRMPRETVEALLSAYYDNMSGPGHLLIIADVTADTDAQLHSTLRRFVSDLAESSDDPFHPYVALAEGEQVTVITYAARVQDVQTWVHPTPASRMQRPPNATDGSNDRALYSAIQRAYTVAYQGLLIDEHRPHAVVLLAAGPASAGLSKETFEKAYRILTERAPRIADVPTHTIAIGAQGLEPLSEIAELTNGTPFKASLGTLPDIFQMVRSYQ